MSVGKINPFVPGSDDIESWVEVLESYLIANAVDKNKDQEKSVAILLSSLGVPTYSLLRDLASPDKPATKDFDALVTILTESFL